MAHLSMKIIILIMYSLRLKMNNRKPLAIGVLILLAMLPITEALSISNVRVTDVTDTSAVVRWETDQDADSTVRYGSDKNGGLSAQNPFQTKQHTVALQQLNKSTAYFASVQSGAVEDTNNGQLYSFTTVAQDTTPPRVEVNLPAVTNKRRIDIVGETEVGTDLRLFQENIVKRSYISTNGLIEFLDVGLTSGQMNTFRIDARDAAGNSNSRTFTVFADVVAPKITLAGLPGVTSEDSIVVSGGISEQARVVVMANNESVFEQDTVTFNVSVGLEEGDTVIAVTATDSAGNSDHEEHTIARDSSPPEIGEVTPLDDNPFYYEGRATDTIRGTTEPGARVFLLVGGRTGASVAAGPGGGASGAFGPSGTGREPTLKEVIDNAQFKTTSDFNGSFKIEDVNFQFPSTTAEDLTPRQVEPGIEGLTGQQQRADLEDQTRAIPVYIAVVDDVGLGSVKSYSVDLGNCFSGFFDFSVKTLPSYQTPGMLSPQRLDAGTEIVSFVMNVNYSGRAGSNLRDPRAERKDNDGYYEIANVMLEPTCRRNDPFINRDPSYQYACQMMKGRPAIARAIDPLGTNWYFRYNLGASDKFTDFEEEFWKQLANNELKFPFKITIDYREKLVGRQEQSKTQSLCRDVSYFVDVPIDPRKVLPDKLLVESQKAINDTLTQINKVLPILEDAIKYVGIGCMGSFGLRTIVQIYRRIVQKWEYATCNVLGKIKGLGDKDEKCPIQSEEQLNACFYIKEGNDVPYPVGQGERTEKCQGVLNNPGTTPPWDIEQHEKMKKYFGSTISAWRAEANLYSAYRFLCDRIFCHAAPAKWTQDYEVAAIQRQIFAQQQCAADSATSGRVLHRRDNCYQELAEKQKIPLVITPESIKTLYGDTCYEYYGRTYIVKEEKNQDKCNGAALLERIDRRIDVPVKDSKVPQDIAGPTLCASRVGNSFYTADPRVCVPPAHSKEESVCGQGWTGRCLTPKEAEGKGWYPFGPTKDCWVDTKSKDHLCYCEKDTAAQEEERTRKENVINKGAAYAGTEPEGVVKTSLTTESRDDGKWPWNYREWQIYRSSGGGAGIYYPEERYYSGRDQTAAFGQNYLLDSIFGTKTPTVDPRNQHIGAFQSVCLSGIRGRILMLRNVLTGVNNCLEQIKTTGKADAGVCKEIFSQFVCNLAYQAFTLVQNQCVAQPFTPAVKKAPGVGELLEFTSESVTETLSDTAQELHDEYGNAQLDQYLEGGTQALVKKVCLAAFGIDTGFDFESFIDAAYSVPMASSVGVFSSRGMRGTREFLSFNPQNFNSVYEYRAAWTIAAGCELESYRVDLVAVTEQEARGNPNIDCSAVNNFEPESQNGCDNWNGKAAVTPQPLHGSSGRVAQGSFIDQNKALVVESPYRYDHVKITLFADKRQSVDACFPKEHRQGDTAVYYFPIYDTTGKDVVQCSVQATDWKFMCTLGELSSLAQTFIEDVSCWDPRTSEYRRCDRITLTVAENDPVKAKVTVFSTGQDKVCLDTFVRTQNAGEKPLHKQAFIEIPGLGRPGSIPIEVTPIAQIDNELFKGITGGGITLRDVVGQVSECSFTADTSFDSATPTEKLSGTSVFTFTPLADADAGKFTVKLDVSIKPLTQDFSRDSSSGLLKKGTQDKFTLAELGDVVYRVNGYGVKNVVPQNTAKEVRCTFVTTKVESGTPPSEEQQWTLHTELYYPDENQQCYGDLPAAASISRTAFETRKQVPLKVRNTKTETALVTAYQNGKKIFKQAQTGENKNRFTLYQSAVTEFNRVLSSGVNVEGTREEFLSYWWSIAALGNMWSIKKDDAAAQAKIEQDILRAATIFAQRLKLPQVKANTALLHSAEMQLVQVYAAAIEKQIGKKTGQREIEQVWLLEKADPAGCVECGEIEREWGNLVTLLKIPHPTKKSEGTPWYWDVENGVHKETAMQQPIDAGKYVWKRDVTLTSTSEDELVDYQILVKLDTKDLISSSALRNDCSDMRFVDKSGKSLPYWIESGCNQQVTSIWVRIPKILPQGTEIITLLYGNSNAQSESSRDAVLDKGLFYYYHLLDSATVPPDRPEVLSELSTGVSPTIDYNLGDNVVSLVNPDAEKLLNNVYVVWYGWIVDGEPNLVHIETDDGVKFFGGGWDDKDSTLHIYKWSTRSKEHFYTYPPINKLNPYKIKLEWFENTGAAVIRLGWEHSSSGDPTYPIPSNNLRTVKDPFQAKAGGDFATVSVQLEPNPKRVGS